MECNICYTSFDQILIKCGRCTFQLCQECFDHDLESCPQCRAPTQNVRLFISKIKYLDSNEIYLRNTIICDEKSQFKRLNDWFRYGWDPSKNCAIFSDGIYIFLLDPLLSEIPRTELHIKWYAQYGINNLENLKRFIIRTEQNEMFLNIMSDFDIKLR